MLILLARRFDVVTLFANRCLKLYYRRYGNFFFHEIFVYLYSKLKFIDRLDCARTRNLLNAVFSFGPVAINKTRI
jgi:hypothetical protein